MDQVSQVKDQFRMEQWKQRIQECQASGMSISKWCKQNGFVKQTYYRYLKCIRQQLYESLPIPVTKQEQAVTFSKLEVTALIPDTKAVVIIRLPNATPELK